MFFDNFTVGHLDNQWGADLCLRPACARGAMYTVYIQYIHMHIYIHVNMIYAFVCTCLYIYIYSAYI